MMQRIVWPEAGYRAARTVWKLCRRARLVGGGGLRGKGPASRGQHLAAWLTLRLGDGHACVEGDQPEPRGQGDGQGGQAALRR